MPQVGPLGRNLTENLQHLCKERRLSLNKLSAALEAAGRPIPPLGLSRLVKGERRVDVDELVALAEVFGVTPGELLAPPGSGKPGSDHVAVRAAQDLAEKIGQLLAADRDPAGHEALIGSVDRATRRVAVEVEELLAETAGQARKPASPAERREQPVSEYTLPDGLPAAAALVGELRAAPDAETQAAIIARYPALGKLAPVPLLAQWLGIDKASVYVARTRQRPDGLPMWPGEDDTVFGRKVWKFATIALHRASAPGRGWNLRGEASSGSTRNKLREGEK